MKLISDCCDPRYKRNWVKRCECGMIIECEVKSEQSIESIEHTRRKGSQFVGKQFSNERLTREGGLWNEWKEQN